MYKGWYENVPYIATCEGDDYWTNPYKLQKHVDYMERHPKCGLVWAKAREYYHDKHQFGGINVGDNAVTYKTNDSFTYKKCNYG